MSVRRLSRIALMGCLEFVAFAVFSDILYLEVITLVTVMFALIFDKQEAVLASVVFVFLNMLLRQGITTWSLMYCLIYPVYSFIIGSLKNHINKHIALVVILTGILSFLTGQLMQLPYMLVSKNLTILYLISGLQTSLTQGVISAISISFVYYPINKVLSKIKGDYENEENF